MEQIKAWVRNFSRVELALWGGSVLLIVLSFLLFDRVRYLTLAASLIGATSLILAAKGDPLGQLLIIVFSVLYGIISYQYAYYGEMITYLGMTAPMAAVAFVSWRRNLYQGSRSVVVGRLSGRGITWMLVLTAVVTAVFYQILKACHTANLIPSTLSVTTSFLAVYLTFRRSPYYAVAYAANDIILICLWTLAAQEDRSYVSVVVCFVLFLVNDLYGYLSWIKRRAKQEKD
jgi:nicotinamide mononucleotide transporter PnuC